MFLPEGPLTCIRMLEQAGFTAYAVGGCVRDSLLGLMPHDYDLCTDAAPEEIARVFSGYSLVRSGEKHGTIGVVMDHTVYEITTFRTEGGYRDSRHPDWVRFLPTVEEDLARRDFTVNAMAYSPAQGYIDPWGGREDLQNRILRAVGDPATRFTEDALRILRGVRFAVRYGLMPTHQTEQAMTTLSPLMEKLARERVYDELCKLLPLVTPQDLLRFAPVLTAVIPELAPCVGFDQMNPHHIHDIFTHTAHVTGNIAPDPVLRWAALLHDVGKPVCFTLDETGCGHFLGHAKESARMAEEILRRLKAPTALREQVVLLIEQHMTLLPPDKKILRRRLGKLGEQNLRRLLALQQADHAATRPDRTDSPEFAAVQTLIEELLQENACLTVRDLAIHGGDLLAMGFAPGPALGTCLSALLEQVQDEMLPNEKDALLSAAGLIMKEI